MELRDSRRHGCQPFSQEKKSKLLHQKLSLFQKKSLKRRYRRLSKNHKHLTSLKTFFQTTLQIFQNKGVLEIIICQKSYLHKFPLS